MALKSGWVIGIKRRRLLVFAIIAVGIFLRMYQFPDNPPGLYVDEAYAGYDAYSILHTGMDEWGIRFPVYFNSSSAGQSVLYSYLSIPFVWAFGLSRFSIRLLSLFVGILTLPLLYVTVVRAFGKGAAILSTVSLAIMPWHVMISRWALDANLLPFVLLLATCTLSRALESRSRLWTLVSLVPLGLSLYAYAMAFVVVPLLLLLLILFKRKAIWSNRKTWFAAFFLFALLAFPIALFIAKNFLFHEVLRIEAFLPFGIPLLPVNRLEQLSSPFGERLGKILFFLLSGFQDGEIRNAVPGNPPTFVVLFPLTIVGVWLLYRKYRQRAEVDLFLIWLAACLPLYFLADLAIHRINAVYIPMLVVGIYGFVELQRRLGTEPISRKIFHVGVASLVAIQAIAFASDYFFVYPTSPDTEIAFFKGFDRALNQGISIASPSDTILVTERIAQPHMLTATYANYPPEKYQREVAPQLNSDQIQIKSLGRFHFGADNIPNPDGPFTFVLGKWDQDPCANPRIALETRLWKVGRCN